MNERTRLAAAVVLPLVIVISFAKETFAIDERSLSQGFLRYGSPLRTEPPHGLLNLFVGQEFYTLKSGIDFEVLDVRKYGGFSGSHLWYKIRPKDTKSGWVYGGIEGQTGNSDDGVVIREFVR